MKSKTQVETKLKTPIEFQEDNFTSTTSLIFGELQGTTALGLRLTEGKSWKLPKEVKVLGVVYKVKVSAALKSEGTHGETDCDKHVIRIRKYDESQKDLERSTLIHEMLHAALGQSGLGYLFRDNTEEALVRMLEGFLFPFIDFTKIEGGKE